MSHFEPLYTDGDTVIYIDGSKRITKEEVLDLLDECENLDECLRLIRAMNYAWVVGSGRTPPFEIRVNPVGSAAWL